MFNEFGSDLVFVYGDFGDPLDRVGVIDPLFTLTASQQQFELNYGASNRVNQTEGSTNNGSALQDAIADLNAEEPLHGKFYLGSEIEDATNGAREAVVGELVRYRLGVVLTDSFDLTNVRFTDTMTPGLAFVSLDLIEAPAVTTSLGDGTFAPLSLFQPTVFGGDRIELSQRHGARFTAGRG